MTTSRIVRGTKGRIFLYVIAVIFLTGIIACYNSTLSHLEDVKKANEVCRQENENLNTQLQMISDYKQRLETSMKSEKAEHEQKLRELREKSEEEKTASNKTIKSLQLQLGTLQSHHKLLETQLEDEKQKWSEKEQEHKTDLSALEATVKELEEKVAQLQKDKENLKNDYLQMQEEKKKLEQRVKGTQTNSQLMENEVGHLHKEISQLHQELDDAKFGNPRPDNNVGEEPPAKDAHPNDIMPAPVLPSKETVKSSSKVLDAVAPMVIPAVTPETGKGVSKGIINAPVLKIPDGVVHPAPLQMDGEKKADGDDKQGVNNDINEAIPNRYRGNIIEHEKLNEEKAEESERDMRHNAKADEDNGANEVFDERKEQQADVMAVGDNPNDGQEGQDYAKEGANDVQIDDPEEDDDPDYFGHNPRRPKEPAVRN